jgi:cellulose synthase/poly-beta-1,6-N-acetylglucosamine synthase-like glycosyltransferase
VPVFNEENIIEKKIKNLRDLKAEKDEVIFVDASSDKTAQIIEKNISSLPNSKLIRSEKAGRSYQINKALKEAKGDFILITDVDAMMEQNALEQIKDKFRDEELGVVAGYVIPLTNYKVDFLFWKAQNSMRLIESFYQHCPVASGACYAFRKGLLEELPQDVWADDIYIPFLANLAGFKSIYSPDVIVKETRAPANFKDFLVTKVRKAQDNIKELLRFFPKIPEMKIQWSIVYITRFIQVILCPIFSIFIIFLLLFNAPPAAFILYPAIFILLLSLFQFYILSKISPGKNQSNIIDTAAIFALTNFILIWSLLSFMFSKNKKCYSRIGE